MPNPKPKVEKPPKKKLMGLLPHEVKMIEERRTPPSAVSMADIYKAQAVQAQIPESPRQPPRSVLKEITEMHFNDGTVDRNERTYNPLRF